MEKGLSYPDQAVITNAIKHDRGQLEVLIDDKSCMYVFDRGYLDYERFDRMTDDGYFFVSRLRKNAVVRVLETFSLQTESNVLSDEMVVIGSTQNRSENIFRRLRILDTKGNELTLLTNRFDLDADEIAEIRSEEHTSELQSRGHLVCRLLLEKKKITPKKTTR